ncbi:unnamed protein product [Thelazia callipaeda]|uniref:C2H2-type domain-containing protein n=1 Tax=Thelazia callipaeda TaxID=103827 RepID=A0A0N5D593_THECL|nr:unnamed protein product [Thelazia callipaeda]
MNHMREGGNAGMSSTASAALGRISCAKSAVQVRCRACQEVLSCPSALRQHCESRAHAARIAQLASKAENVPSDNCPSNTTMPVPLSPETVLECRRCSFETTNSNNAIG